VEGKYVKQNILHGIEAISELTKLSGHRCDRRGMTTSVWTKPGRAKKADTRSYERRLVLIFGRYGVTKCLLRQGC
jgi:hypothetical protein